MKSSHKINPGDKFWSDNQRRASIRNWNKRMLMGFQAVVTTMINVAPLNKGLTPGEINKLQDIKLRVKDILSTWKPSLTKESYAKK